MADDLMRKSTVTPEELAELAKIPGNEKVTIPRSARPSRVDNVRVCVRLSAVPEIPMLAGETLAVFVRTHDRDMAEEVARAALHAHGLEGEVIS